MGDLKLGAVESRFAEIIWENEPLTTNQLIKICADELEWKRTTTYTVLKKLSEKCIFKTENSVVTSVISRQEFDAMQSEQFVEENFKGSLPAFLAAFTARRKLTDKEIEEMKQLLEQMRG